jgi:hypothetical protein
LRVCSHLGIDSENARGKHPCPVCHEEKFQVAPVIWCWKDGGDKAHNKEVWAHMRTAGVVSGSRLLTRGDADDGGEDEAERVRRATAIWNDLEDADASILRDSVKYFRKRGLTVPPTARLQMSIDTVAPDERDERALKSHDYGIVYPVRDKTGALSAVHISPWLQPTAELDTKREQEPVKQTFGPIRGRFIDLGIDFTARAPLPCLLIGEGVETVLAAMQLTGLPGIALGGVSAFATVDPPDADKYILLVDCDENNTSRDGAGKFAMRFPEKTHLAKPDRPESCTKKGYDWNDALLDYVEVPGGHALLRGKILQAPQFKDQMTDREKDAEVVDRLARLKMKEGTEVEFSRALKKAAKIDLKVDQKSLRKDVEDRVDELRAEKRGAARPATDKATLERAAKRIIDSKNVLKLLVDDIKPVIAGETNNVKMLYLSCSARVLPKCMHVAIKGQSSAGKSNLIEEILRYFPAASVVRFTSLSPQALFYLREQGLQHKIFYMGEAVGEGSNHSFEEQWRIIRQLISEGRIDRIVVVKIGDGQKSERLEVEGPVAALVSTARNYLDAELETRMLSLQADDSATQTGHVIDKAAVVIGLNAVPARDYTAWHAFQTLLEMDPATVVIPWAPCLAKLLPDAIKKSVRVRRDWPQVLTAVRTCALLHRYHRTRDDKGCVVATIGEDYRLIRDLLNEIIARQNMDRVEKQIRMAVEAVQALAENAETEEAEKGFTRAQIADEVGWNDRTARRWVGKAETEGYLDNVAPGKGGRSVKKRYVVAEDRALPEYAEVHALPSVADLLNAFEAGDEDEQDTPWAAES